MPAISLVAVQIGTAPEAEETSCVIHEGAGVVKGRLGRF
jgi:hypothetical protein